jgi:DivIVA domain-containing protein
MSFEFSLAVRGYDRRAVDALLIPAVAAITDGDERARANAAAAVRAATLPVVLRGYNRRQVDAALQRLVARLEGAPG